MNGRMWVPLTSSHAKGTVAGAENLAVAKGTETPACFGITQGGIW